MDYDARRTVCMASCAEPKTYVGCITRCGATPNLQPGGQLAAIAGAQPGALGDALAKFWQTGELSDDLKAASDPSGMFKLRYFRVSHADGDELLRTWGEPHETIADAMHVWRDPAAKTMVAMGMSPNRVTLVPTPYQTFADILGLQGELLGLESYDWLSEATSPTAPHVAGATRLPGDNPTYLLPFTTERANPIMLSILMTGGKASAIHLNF
ncbi:MAG: hypothetical protein IPL79_09940 [Myxococcales bacterium]|nr:hypothetical protein [Myxococcales bacterium]